MPRYIPVLIPEELLPHVHAILARGVQAPGLSTGAPPATPTPGDEKDWHVFWADQANVRQHLSPRSDTTRALLRYLAKHVGQQIGIAKIAADLGQPEKAIGGSIGPLGAYLNRRDLGWPYDWDVRADGRVVMEMNRDVANAVLAEVPAS